MRSRTGRCASARRSRRTAGRSLAVIAVMTAVALAGSACSQPVNAGDAGADEFKAWARAHPSEDYRVVRVRGQNPVPFGGTLDLVVAVDGPDPLEERMDGAARGICEFDPKIEDLSIGVGFREKKVTVPLSCPRDGVAQWVFRVEAQADLLQGLVEVPGVVSIDWSPATSGGSFYYRAEPGADLRRVSRRIEAVIHAHPRAFDDPAGVTVS